MPTYYVGPGGNDGNSGLTWALRKLTLNGAEDVPVVAGDTIYVGPGVYRETLTVDVSGGAGNPITYIADVTGENTDGVGGVVRITGSDDDQTVTRLYCILDVGTHNYRTFRGFKMDLISTGCVAANPAGTHWIVEDCAFSEPEANQDNAIYVLGASQANWTIRRCYFNWANSYLNIAIYFYHSSTVNNTGHLVENCTITADTGVMSARVGGITIRGCTFTGIASDAVRVSNALTVGQTITVKACIFYGVGNRVFWAIALGEIIEDYNTIWCSATHRFNVAVGANSLTYPPLWDMGLLHAGASQASGFKLPYSRPAELLGEWSQVAAIADGGTNATLDFSGLTRPVTDGKRSWGSVQFDNMQRDTATVQGGVASLELSDAGRVQFKIPVTAIATTVSVYVYREANYAGNNPQMIVKQPGQADRTTTDAGAAGAWNQLTDTWVPSNTTDFVVIELVSRNTAAAGNYATYFDTLTVSVNTSLGLMETWLWDRSVADWVQSVPAGAGAVSISPLRGGLGG